MSLIVAGFGGALVYALAWGRGAVWISPFISWWIALSCGTGGLIAGRRGGTGVWWPAGRIGVLGGGLVLALLALMAPESLGPGDLLTYCLLPAGLSCAGALAGANMPKSLHKKLAEGPAREAAREKVSLSQHIIV